MCFFSGGGKKGSRTSPTSVPRLSPGLSSPYAHHVDGLVQLPGRHLPRLVLDLVGLVGEHLEGGQLAGEFGGGGVLGRGGGADQGQGGGEGELRGVRVRARACVCVCENVR